MKRLSTDATRFGTRIISLFALALPLALAACEKDEPPPPLPAPAPAEPPAQTELVMDEEALPEDDSTPTTATRTGGGSAGGSLRACCAALHQNAANAPPPNDGYLKTAAGICDGMVAAGQTGGAATALRAALQGAGLPSSCQ